MTFKYFEANENEFDKSKKPYGHTAYQKKTKTGKLAQVPAKGVKPPRVRQSLGPLDYIGKDEVDGKIDRVYFSEKKQTAYVKKNGKYVAIYTSASGATKTVKTRT